MPRELNVVQALGWYFPESSGGTEVYVNGLVRHLRDLSVRSEIVAAADGESSTSYSWDQAVVHRYPVGAAARREIVGGGPHEGFEAFAAWLKNRPTDIYHQHSWTRGCGPHHLRFARSLGLKTIVTVHVPSLICPRGTMMLHGSEACDGRVDVARCTRCWSEERGIPSPIASWQAAQGRASSRIASMLPSSRLKTMMATPALVEQRQQDILALATEADLVVAVCEWLHQALLANGVPASKLALVPHGTDVPVSPVRPTGQAAKDLFTVGFIGRWDRVKGVHTLVEAFRRLPSSVRAELVIHGLAADAAYEAEVRAAAASISRVRIEPSVRRDQVINVLAGFDMLAVPSEWLETGPLVVLEAFAAGTPVLGSDLGGIAELVTDGVTGTLVPAGDPGAWAEAIASLAGRPRPLFRPIATPRSTSDVARDMRALYDEVMAA